MYYPFIIHRSNFLIHLCTGTIHSYYPLIIIPVLSTYGGFHKWGYPQIIHFSGIFPNKNQPFLGTSIYGNLHIIIQLFREKAIDQHNSSSICLRPPKNLLTYWFLAGNGLEWGNGILINNYYGSFPHSLLSTSKKIHCFPMFSMIHEITKELKQFDR